MLASYGFFLRFALYYDLVGCRNTRETTPCSLIILKRTSTPGSTTRPNHSSHSTVQVPVSTMSISRALKDLFGATEQQQQQAFIDKYEPPAYSSNELHSLLYMLLLNSLELILMMHCTSIDPSKLILMMHWANNKYACFNPQVQLWSCKWLPCPRQIWMGEARLKDFQDKRATTWTSPLLPPTPECRGWGAYRHISFVFVVKTWG